MPDLAAVPVIINSELAKKHATAQDRGRWKCSEQRRGLRRLQARVLEARAETIYARFATGSRAVPKLKPSGARVPSPATAARCSRRRCRHLVRSWPPKDFARWQGRQGGVVSHPVENAFTYVGMETVKNPPFSNLKVRQRGDRNPLRQDLHDGRLGRGVLLSAIPIVSLTAGHELFPSPFRPIMAKAQGAHGRGRLPNGFETTLSFGPGLPTINEPAACWCRNRSRSRASNAIKQDPRRQLAATCC